MKKDKKKFNKGFSLLEAVISILLVTIIMTAVLSTIMYTNQATKNAEKKMFAINEIDNIITCYKAKDYSYYGFSKFENNQELKFNKDFELCDSSNYYYKIVLYIGIKTISATAYDNNGKKIYQMENPYVLGGS